MTRGEFPPASRAAILEATHQRCAGCGSSGPLNTQHRHARGIGGTRDPWLGMPCNGVALCGSGTTGCHGWAEAHPRHADALGWRVTYPGPGVLPGPFYTLNGWLSWTLDGDPTDPRSWLVEYVTDPRDRPAGPGDVAAARKALTMHVRNTITKEKQS